VPVTIQYTYDQLYVYKEVHFKSKLQHTGTWLAAACPTRQLCYRLAVFFLHLLHNALQFPQEKISARVSKMFYFHFVIVKNS
jgi:hypothetical protein